MVRIRQLTRVVLLGGSTASLVLFITHAQAESGAGEVVPVGAATAAGKPVADRVATSTGQAPAPPQSAAAAISSASAESPSVLSPALADKRAELKALRARRRAGSIKEKELLEPRLIEARTAYRRALTEATESYVATQGDIPDAELQALASPLREMLVAEASFVNSEFSALSQDLVRRIEKAEKAEETDAAEAEADRDKTFALAVRVLIDFDESIRNRRALGVDVASETLTLKRVLTDNSKTVAGLLGKLGSDVEHLANSSVKDGETAKALDQLKSYRSLVADFQRAMIRVMGTYEMDTVELRESLILNTGEISQDVLDAEVATGLAKKWQADAQEWLLGNGLALAFRAVTFLFIVAVFWVFGRIARALVRVALIRSSLAPSVLARDFTVSITGKAFLFAGVLVGAAQLGIEVGTLLAGLGVAGFVIGFALQNTLSNFASGILILIYRPYDVGDTIEAGGVLGSVKQMSLVSTSILTFDNQMLVVPNNKIWDGVICNLTHQKTRRVDLMFGAGYTDDIEHIERVLKEIVDQNSLVLEHPEPKIRLHELGDSSVNFIVRPWVATADYWDAYWQITREVKRRFDAEGISIPFPQRDVHLHKAGGGETVQGA